MQSVLGNGRPTIILNHMYYRQISIIKCIGLCSYYAQSESCTHYMAVDCYVTDSA